MAKNRLSDGKFISVAVIAVTVGAAGVTFLFKLYEFVAASTTGSRSAQRWTASSGGRAASVRSEQ